MTHTLTTAAARAGLLAAAALLLACAAPAQAGPPPRGALLLCDPPRGHARAARACAELDAVNGRIADIPLRETHCPMIHAPVTAQARGQWRGQPVEYTQTFSNDCVMAARTGAVFAWDTQD
ncbi:serine protease [Streptomyces sp. 4F]|nr:serine protease [Streptomyces sp. 4F]